MSILAVGPREFSPRLVIFDKDGTLIDFHVMWATWARDLARRLEAATHKSIAAPLFRALAFDAASNHVVAGGTLAVTPMAELRSLTARVLRDARLTDGEVERALAAAWHAPDPIALACPLTDLRYLFAALRERGAQVTIATSDDRVSTEATLRAFGVESLVDALICADDGLPIKPAPDMVLHLCQTLAVALAHTVVVGDAVPDMQMAKAAGVALAVGVTSGVSTRAALAPFADVVIGSVAELIA
ncbi:MAG: HAD family hydrolase [Chloroflexota bacterium]